MAKRFYQLAFDLGVHPRGFMRDLANVGLSVGNQMVIVPDELEARIREVYDQIHVPEPVATEEPPAPATPIDAPVVETEITDVAPQEAVPVEAPVEEAAPLEEVQPVAADAGDAAVAGDAPAEVEEETGRKHESGATPKPKDLVPTLDPRAGRLVREAPKGGIPGLQPRPRTARTPDPATMNPNLRQPERAPGARRDSGRRTTPDRWRHKRGKETFHMRRRGFRSKSRPAQPKVRPDKIQVELPITVKRFCELSTYKAAEIIKVLFSNHKIMVQPNSMLDKDTVEILSLELDMEVEFVEKATAEDELLKEFETEDAVDDLRPRPPVVTVLGHVDHGKTTLLDKIRETDVAGREAGGITQHIGAYQVTLKSGRKLTFIDTPGHEAFSEMRARGAQVTDIVILIVAGDDGVMPQTVEAISHAKAAGVNIVVAITKCDKDGCQPERVKQQLTEHEVYVEGYGGDVSVFEVSGITGQGLPELLEHIALIAEVDEEHFRANPNRLATGTVIESQSNPKRGILTTVLVQNGTLRKGDAVLAGEAWGTVRGLFDDKGKPVKEAGPSTPVEIIGLDSPPETGSKFYEAENATKAKRIAETRAVAAREAELAAQTKPTTVESLLGAIDSTKVEEVNVVLKADVRGSLAPLRTVLDRLATDEVRVKVLHAAVGPINESDVTLAAASKALIIGFHVNADAKARNHAKELGVDWRNYKVIYEIESDIRDMMEGRLAPEYYEEVLGHVEILAIFTFSKIGNIAGCRVKDGVIKRDALVRVHRGEELIHEGQLSSLRREKDEAKEVKEGFECGLTIKGWDEFEIGDMVEAYVIKTKRRKLGDSRKDK